MLRDECFNIVKSSRGRQVLTLFQVDELVPVVESDLDTLKSLVKDYETLKQRPETMESIPENECSHEIFQPTEPRRV